MPGKWSLHQFYMGDSRFRKLLPETQLLSPKSFRALLGKYGSVYVKPNMEHTGKGIMKVWKMGDSYRLVKIKGEQRKFESLNEVTRSVMKEAGGKPHIVQKTIDLAEISKRPYDIRVMMMRDQHDRWLYIGTLAKVAGKTSIVTNVRRGKGFVLPVEEALQRSLNTNKTRQKHILNKMIKTSYDICNRFNRYKYSSQIGIDFAVDRSGQLWIIEVNFDYPSHALFAQLTDKRIYNLIKKTHSDYIKGKRQRNA